MYKKKDEVHFTGRLLSTEKVMRVQILDEAGCISFHANTHGKNMNPSFHPIYM